MEFLVKVTFTCTFADSRIQAHIREAVEQAVKSSGYLGAIDHEVELHECPKIR